MNKVLISFFALLALNQSAYAGVGLLGGASFHSVSTSNSGSTPTLNSSSKLGFLGGLAFSSNFMLLNLEIDALYDYRTLNIINSSLINVSASSPAIEVPVLVRFSVVPMILDFGVGPYASFNVGNNALGYSSPDFGATGSLRVTVPIPYIHLVVDGRYVFGLSNLSQIPGLTLHTRELQILAGIDIPFFGDDSGGSKASSN